MKKRNIKTILLFEVILLIIVCTLTLLTCFSNGLQAWDYFIDIPSFLGILLLTIPGMILMGSGKDFCSAFSVGQKEYSLLELKNILEAVKVCQKLALIASLLEMTIASVAILTTLDDLSLMGPNLAVMILSGLYAILLEFLLLPLLVNTKKVINEEIEHSKEA